MVHLGQAVSSADGRAGWRGGRGDGVSGGKDRQRTAFTSGDSKLNFVRCKHDVTAVIVMSREHRGRQFFMQQLCGMRDWSSE